MLRAQLPLPSGAVRRIGRVLAPLLLLVVLVASGNRAAAHATFVRSDPPPNATLPTAPTQVQMWFAEPLERSGSTASLYDAGGKEIAGTRVAFGADPAEMTLTAPAKLPAGVYTVAWQTESAADGHVLPGYFAFTVGAAAGTTAAFTPVQNPGAPLWLQAVARWLALLGLAAAVAIWPLWALVLQPALTAVNLDVAVAAQARRFAWLAVAAALLGNLAALLVQAATLGSAHYASALGTTASETRYGRLWWLRLGLLAAYAVALRIADWKQPWRRPLLAAAGLILAAALPIPVSLNAHAAAEPAGAAMAVAADVLHLLGASVWAGGLIVLLAVLLPALRGRSSAERRAVLARALPRFSAVALVAWAVLGLSGLYNAWLQVGSLAALRDTVYGQTLLIKLALAVPLLMLGAVNLLVVSPRIARPAPDWTRRLARSVGAEAILVVVVLLVVGRLTSLEPARADFAAAHPAGIVVPLVLDPGGANRSATLTITPGAAGPNQYRLAVAGAPLPSGSDALLRLTLPTVDLGTKEVALTRDGDATFTGHGSELGIAGAWTVETIVRKIGAFAWDATQTLAIGPTPPATAATRPAWHLANWAIVGAALLLAGFIAAVLAWRQPRRQRGWLGTAALALAGGAVVVALARVAPPATATPATAPATPAAPIVGVAANAPSGPSAAPAPVATTAAAAAGTPVTRDGMTATLLPAAWRMGPTTLTAQLVNAAGTPVTNAAVTVIVRSLDMDMGTTSVAATETAPGRYDAVKVPLSMGGRWQATLRVVPRGQPAAAFVFDLDVAGGATAPMASPASGRAGVYGGRCDQLGPLAFPLPSVNAAPLTSPPTTAGDLHPILVDHATLAVALDRLLASDHAIVLTSTAAPTHAIVCGTLGGARQGDRLIVGLAEQGASDDVGFAVLTPAGDATQLTLYLGAGLAPVSDRGGATPAASS
ncbi:MAG TPA: CopD family protein [Thermomicrobiales bacterium]|nr:CopD family protein [Thermomicrobiales bacterium]